MINLLLKRCHFAETYTIGKLYVDGVYFSDTLEDKVREYGVKVQNETAIPSGTYKVIMSISQKFKRILPRLLDVPMFEGILIHRGNTVKDTSGCILIGENKAKGMVLDSTKYEEKLVELLKQHNDIQITIENE